MFWISWVLLYAFTSQACIWDADTLLQEKLRSHDLAQTILGQSQTLENPEALRGRIKALETNRDESNPDWWNNLAGAYLRLGQPGVAVKLLKPAVERFPDNYGIHANLGTAYHLLGRYADAEQEIALDLEINPNAHFGLEKYHLALLQYLVRDTDYKKQHLYVDEWSRSFNEGHFHKMVPDGKLDAYNTNALDLDQINSLAKDLVYKPEAERTNCWQWQTMQELKNEGYVPPPYRFQWDLASNTNFEAGVIYMAQMNPNEPACYEMLGIAAGLRHDYHLEADAFEKAIQLGSPKAEMLQEKVVVLRDYIRQSLWQKFGIWGVVFLVSLVPLLILYYLYSKILALWRKSKTTT